MSTALRKHSWNDLTSWMDDLFNDSYNSFFSTGLSLGRGSYPKVDILDENDKLVFECSVPGLKKEDISVTLDNNVLTITGESVTKKATHVLKELHRSAFSRSFNLSRYKLDGQPECTMKDGILTISFKKLGENDNSVTKLEIK